VAVDHDRFEARLPEGVAGVDAAVVELDALTDAVRTPAQDDDLGLVRTTRLVLVFVGRVEVRSRGLELGRAGVDRLVDGDDAELPAAVPELELRRPEPAREPPVRGADALGGAQLLARNVGESSACEPLLGLDHAPDAVEEPGVDARALRDLLDAHARQK